MKVRGLSRRCREVNICNSAFCYLCPFAAQCKLLRKNSAFSYLDELREQEARRIAHALHDEVAQLLASVYLAVDNVAQDLGSPYRERLKAIPGVLDEVEAHLRSLSHELRPTVLDDLGVVSAVELLGQGVSKRTGMRITVRASLRSRPSPPIETNLYRIVQECLNNCARHAHAAQVTIGFAHENDLVECRIKDDGIGFDVAEELSRKGGSGLGLAGIRERVDSLGGTLSIHSAPGSGTEVVVLVPLTVDTFAVPRFAFERFGRAVANPAG